MRFPRARDTDPDEYASRLDYLANDTAHIAVPLLRAACDRAAQSARGLPYASEILACAAAIVENRQRQAPATDNPAMARMGDKAAAYAASNLVALSKGMRVMQTAGGELFKLGEPGERRGLRSDGSAIEPWFHTNAGPADTIATGWYVTRDDAPAMSRCFADAGAGYRMNGAMIVEASA